MLSLCFEEEDVSCTFCNTEKETFFHFATSCPAFIIARGDAFQGETPNNDMEWRSIKDLLTFSKHPSIDKLLNPFYQETQDDFFEFEDT